MCAFRSGVDGRVCTMHANCCIGLGNKMHELRSVVEAWNGWGVHGWV